MRRWAALALAWAAAPRPADALVSQSVLHREQPNASQASVQPETLQPRPEQREQRRILAAQLQQAEGEFGWPWPGRRRQPGLAEFGRLELQASRSRQREDPGKQREAFIQSFFVVGVAEIFDKTWFVAVLCSLSFGRRVAFGGSFAALALHTAIAALLGVVIGRFFSVSSMHFVTAGIFTVLSILYAYEWVKAEPRANALEERSEEARGALVPGGPPKGLVDERYTWILQLLRCFVAVFVAEWGDRTQIAMISLHSSHPVLPVCVGSLTAFLALTISAVLVAALLEGHRLSESLILGVGAISFLLFALLATADGVREWNAERPS